MFSGKNSFLSLSPPPPLPVLHNPSPQQILFYLFYFHFVSAINQVVKIKPEVSITTPLTPTGPADEPCCFSLPASTSSSSYPTPTTPPIPSFFSRSCCPLLSPSLSLSSTTPSPASPAASAHLVRPSFPSEYLPSFSPSFQARFSWKLPWLLRLEGVPQLQLSVPFRFVPILLPWRAFRRELRSRIP